MAERALASAYVNIIPSMKGFNKTLSDEVSGSASSVGNNAGSTLGSNIKSSMTKTLTGVGAGILVTMGIHAAIDGLKTSMESLARIEVINKQTETVIASMGNAAGVSAKEIENLSGALENKTATEAESIQQGANLLLTFGNIKNAAGAGNDIFSQTVGIMVDMGRAMGQDASSSAIQLGKALNDPTTGLTALSRVGVSFTDQEKEKIKTLQESGDMMGAQKIILEALQKQFGGSGAAYAETFQGKMDLMNHAVGTIGETIMTSVMPILNDWIGIINKDVLPAIQSFADDFQAGKTPLNDFFNVIRDLFNFVKDNWSWLSFVAGAIIAIAVALGIANGIIAIYQTVMGIATVATWAFNSAWLANPITWIIIAIIAAIALLVAAFWWISSNWEQISAFITDSLTNIGNFFNTIFTNIGIWWNDVVNGMISGFQQFGKWVGDILGGIGNFFSSIWNSMVNGFRSAVNWIIGMFEGMINFIIDGINMFLSVLQGGLSFLKKVTGLNISIGQINKVSLPRLAKGGYVDQPTTALIGEAGPEVVTPLKDFERMMGLDSKGKNGPTVVYNNYANPGLTSEQELLQAMKRGRIQGVV